jgi:Tol biopolymer transport system component
MGEVYKALDTRLDRTVAIKLLSGPSENVAALRERLEREARSLSKLNHPHICTLFDIGETSGDLPGGALSYLVMEYLEGETLADRIARGPLPLDRALTYGGQIAEALDRAHRADVIHGDLKPGNIMLTKSGVKLLDFGLARSRGAALRADWASAATRTVSLGTPDSITGTLQYLSPEQLEGRVSDERADIFACGAVLYEMLTGRQAFQGDSPAAVIAAIVRGELPAVSALVPQASPAVDHVVMLCLAKDPDQRWQHAGDLTHELRWLIATGAWEHKKTSGTVGSSRWWQIAAAGLLVVTLGLVALLALRPPVPAASVYRTSIVLPDGLRFPSGGTIGGGGRLALSPDGRTLAVVVIDSRGTQMLWVRSLEGTVATPLPGTEGAGSPFWSPDSKSIAFVADGALKRIEAAGGQPMQVASPAFNASGSWSRDNQILFTPSANAPLALVPESGGTLRTVTTLNAAAGEQVHRSPSFLPDGRHFLYVAVAGGTTATPARRAIYVGSVDGDAPALVLDNASGARYNDNYLLFLRDTTLFAQAFDADRRTLSGEPRVVAEQIETGGAASSAFTISDAGVLAYQASVTTGSQLTWFDREGRQEGTVGDAASYGDIELSPDGRQVAVTILDPATNTRDIWLVDVGRGVRTRFTFDRGDDVAPIWSRDGTRIMFTSNRNGHYDLFEKAATGVSMETLVYADTAEKYPTSWLSDARALLYWTFNPEGTELKLFDIANGAARTFLASPVSPGRFAPDGRFVLYYSQESGRSEVYLVPFPAPTRKWQVSSNGGNFARWRPDGKEVFYLGRDNRLVATPVQIESDRVTLGQPVALFEARPVGTRYPYDVAPGGERFLINTLGGSSAVTAVTVVQNWTRLVAP